MCLNDHTGGAYNNQGTIGINLFMNYNYVIYLNLFLSLMAISLPHDKYIICKIRTVTGQEKMNSSLAFLPFFYRNCFSRVMASGMIRVTVPQRSNHSTSTFLLKSHGNIT